MEEKKDSAWYENTIRDIKHAEELTLGFLYREETAEIVRGLSFLNTLYDMKDEMEDTERKTGEAVVMSKAIRFSIDQLEAYIRGKEYEKFSPEDEAAIRRLLELYVDQWSELDDYEKLHDLFAQDRVVTCEYTLEKLGSGEEDESCDTCESSSPIYSADLKEVAGQECTNPEVPDSEFEQDKIYPRKCNWYKRRTITIAGLPIEQVDGVTLALEQSRDLTSEG